MNITIENGVSIIKMDLTPEIRNKTGVPGVYYYENKNKYRADITIKYKKYSLGYFKTVEEAKAVREMALKNREDGTFEEWFKEFKK